MTVMSSDALRSLRETVDTAATSDLATFARATRNAVAQAILGAALLPAAAPGQPQHEPPEAEVRALLGPRLGEALSALYRGGDDWAGRAIDLLEPLNEVARGLTGERRPAGRGEGAEDRGDLRRGAGHHAVGRPQRPPADARQRATQGLDDARRVIDIERARADTPGVGHVVHFNNAGSSLPMRQVVDAVVEHLYREAEIGGYEAAAEREDRWEHTYDALARLIGAQ